VQRIAAADTCPRGPHYVGSDDAAIFALANQLCTRFCARMEGSSCAVTHAMSLQYTGSSIFYTELAQVPLPVSANFIGGDVARVTYSVRDHDRNIKRYITKTFDNQCTTSHDSSEIKASATSPSKTRQAILREVANNKRFVEIWAGSQLEASLDVSNYHQAFLTDGEQNNITNTR
jgi:hypothetical protein